MPRIVQIHAFQRSLICISLSNDSSVYRDDNLSIVAPPCFGDFDGDKDADESDAAAFALSFGQIYAYQNGLWAPDSDQDGDVDGLDLAWFASEIGRVDCP